jgi:hypothetical protein
MKCGKSMSVVSDFFSNSLSGAGISKWPNKMKDQRSKNPSSVVDKRCSKSGYVKSTSMKEEKRLKLTLIDMWPIRG